MESFIKPRKMQVVPQTAGFPPKKSPTVVLLLDDRGI